MVCLNHDSGFTDSGNYNEVTAAVLSSKQEFEQGKGNRTRCIMVTLPS